MQENAVDCYFIGHNEMNFDNYEKTVREMGVQSGAYRDLLKNFIYFNYKPHHASEIFNLLCRDHSGNGNPVKPLYIGENFNAAIAYLGTYLQRRGHTFDFINSFHEEKEILAEKLEQGNILTVGIITTLYVSVFPILEIVEFIRQYHKDVKIIVGGPFVSNQVTALNPTDLEYSFKNIGADVYVDSSQGEATLEKVIRAYKNNHSLENIPNIHYKDGDSYRATPLERENNLLSENMVDWTLFTQRAGEFINVRTSISCPFSCSFCGFPEHAGKYQTAEVDAVERELNRLNEIPTLKSVQFIDDTFNIPGNRFKKILRMMIDNKYKFPWHSHYRCQFADEETVALMKESGCEGVFLGIESGNNQILKNMNKAATVEKYYKGVELLKKYDILTYGSFIIGFPGETEQTVQDSIDFIRRSGIDFFRTQLWYCDTVTPIWKEREKYQIEGSHFEWKHATMDSRQASDIIDDIFLSVRDEPVWVPQYNFECDGVFHLLHRGLTVPQIKDFLRAFNDGMREHLRDASQKDASFDVIKRIKSSCGAVDETETGSGDELLEEDYDAGFDF